MSRAFPQSQVTPQPEEEIIDTGQDPKNDFESSSSDETSDYSEYEYEDVYDLGDDYVVQVETHEKHSRDYNFGQMDQSVGEY